MVNRPLLALLVLVAGMGVGYNVLERQADAWPALLVFVAGGFVCGYV